MTDIDLNTLPKTRKEAIEQGSKYYFTGKPCIRGHIGKRLSQSKACVSCNEERYKERFYKNGVYDIKLRRKMHSKNKEQYLKKAREWSERNKEYHKKLIAQWWADNPEKAREYWSKRRAKRRAASGSHSAEEISNLLKKQNYKCAACNKGIKKKYTVDHIVPLSRGGSNFIENIQMLCRFCNTSKGVQDHVDWAQKNGRLL